MRRTTKFVSWMVLPVVLVGGGIFVGHQLQSPEQLAADAAPPPPSVITVQAEVRLLTEGIVLRGSVQPGTTLDVPSPLTGTDAVVTSAPPAAGSTVNSGDLLAEVSGQPVFALETSFPFYRNMVDGDSGPDVDQLQQALRALGYGPGTTRTFSSATQRSLQSFYKDRGYSAPTVNVPGNCPTPPEAPDATEPANTCPDRQLVTFSRQNFARIDVSGRTIATTPVAIGSVLVPGDKGAAVLVTLLTGSASVQAVAPVQQASILTTGQSAIITNETTGETASATVASIAMQSTQSDAGAPGYAVSFSFTGPSLAASAGQSVLVTLDATTGTPSLSVPVTAIYTDNDGQQYVLKFTDSADPQRVAVVVGATAGGWSEITPIEAGAMVDGTSVVVGYR